MDRRMDNDSQLRHGNHILASIVALLERSRSPLQYKGAGTKCVGAEMEGGGGT